MKRQLSTIVALYNNKQYIKQCIDSLYDQGLDEGEFEVIIVDDGSTDGGGAVVDSIAALHGNMRVVHQENKGLGEARNAGLSIATGKYLHFIDADDFLLAGSYRHIIENLMPHDPEIMVLDNVNDATYGDAMIPGHVKYVGDIRQYIENNYMRVHVWIKLFKRSFMETNDLKWPAINFNEDTAITWSALRHDGTLLVSNDKIYSYRANPQGIVRKRDVEHVKKTVCDLVTVNSLLRDYAPVFSGYTLVKSNFTQKYRMLFNRILCTPYSFKEIKEVFARCATIGISHLHPSKDIKVYNLLYNHPVLYYVFQWFIRTAYFARFKVGDNSTDFINRKLSN